jgi:Tol biopolymer transport system component
VTDAVIRLSAALADRYRIERELGAGGMATVYLAHDVRHDRKVALKVLRPELSAILGAERFLHEIKTTANLQHPHILSLFDSGEADGLVFYVMPFVEGESLRDRLTREKQLPVDDAVRIACEVADALDYAHRHGVIHRDIKPENILLHDGRVQVADFGIALAVSTAGAGTRMTETGMSLGTPHYMSPEQAMGQREITAKSDVYSLGCVLYEMLTGEPPFMGPTAQAIIARVMTEEPRSLMLQRKSIPPHVEAAVNAALEKLPADRLPTAAEFAEALRHPGALPLATGRATTSAAGRPAGRVGRAALRIAPWLLAAAAAVAAFWVARHPRTSAETPRFSIVVPDSEGVRTDHLNRSLALAPDGSRFVYAGSGPHRRRMLYERSLGQLDPRLIPGTEGAEGPFFSPDGQWVAFFADGKLKKVALAGGPPLMIADAPNPRGGAWSESGTIVFNGTNSGGLVSVSAAGGATDTLTLTRADTSSGSSHRLPQFLPGGKTVIFTELVGAGVRVAALDLATRRITTLVDQAMDAQYAVTGHLVYGTQTGALVAVPFDARRVRVTGSPVSLLEGLLVKPVAGVAEFALSATGRLVYLAGVQSPRTLVLVDQRGTERPLGQMMGLGSPRFSPDGRRIALSSLEGRSTDIRVLDLERKTLSRLTFEGNNLYPEWTPDGRRVAFATTRTVSQGIDLYWAAADGSGEARPLFAAPGSQMEVQFTPDGKTIAFRQTTPGTATKRDIWIAQVDKPQAPHPYLATPFDERSMVLSPDGHWMAYVSDESGRDEVYVRSFPAASGRWQISVDGGLQPRWAHSGRALFYRAGDSLVSVAVTTRPAFVVGQRSLVFTRPYYLGDTHHAHWDVAPGDKEFVFIRQGFETPSLVVALNWFEELKRRSARGPVATAP